MSFEARLYIQGVGVYVPHAERQELLVLFPDQERAQAEGLRDFTGRTICRHHAVAQFRVPGPDPHLPDLWTTIDLSGRWVGFRSDSTVTPRLFDEGGRVSGVPHLPEVLARAALGTFSALDPRALVPAPGDGLLRAGFYADAGILSPAADYKGKFRFFAGRGPLGTDENYTSVVKIELGEVKTFALRFRAFDSPEVSELPIDPVYDELEVWIRHFCDLAPPDPDRHVPEPGEADADFALNYALLEDLPELLRRRRTDLPFPRISSSWERGSPIGGEPRKCMGSGGGTGTFTSPFAS